VSSEISEKKNITMFSKMWSIMLANICLDHEATILMMFLMKKRWKGLSALKDIRRLQNWWNSETAQYILPYCYWYQNYRGYQNHW
jgi:hypothetical protein